MSTRRTLLRGLGAAAGIAGLGLGAALVPRAGRTAGEEFRALVVVLLEGGHDGHQVLVPTDHGYAEYASSRGAGLTLSRDQLLALPGNPGGRSLALNPSLPSLRALYQQGRLAFVSNVGPLVRPVTAAAVRAGTAEVPLLLRSHHHQLGRVQGALDGGDSSGWGGRALEALPASLRHGQAAIGLSDTERRLLHGRRTPVTLSGRDFGPWWSMAYLLDPANQPTQAYRRLAQVQSTNTVRAEYARSMGIAMDDTAALYTPLLNGNDPAGDFGGGEVGEQLQRAARLLPYLKQQGVRRQVVLVSDTGFDLHRSSPGILPDMLERLDKALSAFDGAVKAAGLDNNVVTLTMSEFGRTLQPSGGDWQGDTGSDHGWGNHWWLMGGPVAGGTVHGPFPSLVLGGADDGDPAGAGVLVPTTSSDQVAAALVRWLGVPAEMLPEVFPDLVNFPTTPLPLLRA